VGAAGGSWAQLAAVKVANKITAVVSRIFEAKRANGIYSSPFTKAISLGPSCKSVYTTIKTLQKKDLVET
jgi:hypothetical protein